MFETFYKYFSNLKNTFSSIGFKNTNKWIILGFIGFTVLGIFLRLWNIGFGLPHSYYADEPELTGFAIHYSVELKNSILENDWFKLVPVSYVYGTFPVYVLTVFIIPYTKFLSLINVSFDTNTLYLYSRIIVSLFSFLLVPAVSYLYYKLFKDKLGSLITFILMALNWKFIVHAHYANSDIFLTLLICLSFLTMFLYSKKFSNSDTLFTLLSGILFGLSVGTKITALITLPLYLLLFIYKKDYRNLFAFCFLVFGAFIISNPFSLIFVNDFIYRIYSMLTKEAGMVFDSVDYGYFKYIFASIDILTLPIFVFSLLGLYKICSYYYFEFKKENKSISFKNSYTFHKFLLANIVFYFIFYSIQSRRVDRWLLPILPIFIMYASYYISYLIGVLKEGSFNYFNKIVKNTYITLILKYILIFLWVGSFLYYLYFTFILLFEFQKNTPKSNAYIWLRENASERKYFERVLTYSEEGLEPLAKLKYSAPIQFKVYESAGASLFYPADPYYFKYIVVSSRPMLNFKNKEVVKKYPYYSEKWFAFENTLATSDFKVVAKYELPHKSLIPISNVYIYENLKFSEYETKIKELLDTDKSE